MQHASPGKRKILNLVTKDFNLSIYAITNIRLLFPLSHYKYWAKFSLSIRRIAFSGKILIFIDIHHQLALFFDSIQDNIISVITGRV